MSTTYIGRGTFEIDKDVIDFLRNSGFVVELVTIEEGADYHLRVASNEGTLASADVRKVLDRSRSAYERRERGSVTLRPDPETGL